VFGTWAADEGDERLSIIVEFAMFNAQALRRLHRFETP
jgi:hypothetical protein